MAETNQTQGTQQGAQQPEAPQGQAPAFDYEKLAGIIQGKQTVAEDTVLKNYFKQQGLSQEEAAQAIAAFKQQKAQSQPDFGALQGKLTEAQGQLTEAQAAVRSAKLEKSAMMAAITLGLDGKIIPYALKMADFSAATDADGKIDEGAVKTALSKVLEDIPALRPQPDDGKGFRQIGTGGDPNQQKPNGKKDQPVIATKKWNRFN